MIELNDQSNYKLVIIKTFIYLCLLCQLKINLIKDIDKRNII